MFGHPTVRRLATSCSALLLAGFLALGCHEDSPTDPGVEARQGEGAQVSLSRAGAPGQQDAEVRRQLVDLRQAIAPFHNPAKAREAGWSVEFPMNCLMHVEEGGMGFHLLNENLVDGEVSVTEPELLVYEPGRNGKLRLVAVEYAVPVTEFDEAGDPVTPRPDPLFGDKAFTLFSVEGITVWQHHVWPWRNNANGLFDDWNPKVDCDAADPGKVLTFPLSPNS